MSTWKKRDEHLKVSRYDLSENRAYYRNGYYERDFMMNIGKKTYVYENSHRGFAPSIFENYQRFNKAFVLSMLEMAVDGVSTRKVKNISRRVRWRGCIQSFVSFLTEKLDPIVNKWMKSRWS
ncbi:transposase [Virgibacillus xinjiangensis]|uniref:Transposase n=1 Tax=Virgibacillus xinjiangensis TaxID=393090 RepID=A0ABV7CQY2_9BACI